MQLKEVEDVITCLSDDRRVFYYFKDRYCFDLIDFEMQRIGVDEISISELKKSRIAKFVNKPLVSNALGVCGGGSVKRSDLALMANLDQIPFSLSLGGWGGKSRGWSQTTRGRYNLVLRVNFSRGHDLSYKKLLKPLKGCKPLEYDSHPICQEGRKTMSWIRMDVDFERDEVLIEEIQNDWLRRANTILSLVKKGKAKNPKMKPEDVVYDVQGSYDNVVEYVEQVLKPYREIWQQASMLAALRFIKYDLGISNIYYHTFETGIELKSVFGYPPKSIYTKLPKQFCFQKTKDVPKMLKSDKKVMRRIKGIKNPEWFFMAC